MMTIGRNVRCAAVAIGLIAPAASIAGAPEPLIVTQLADPDPGYVRPSAEPRGGTRPLPADIDRTLDTAIQDFGRAIGEAAAIQRRAIEARCQSGEANAASAADRFAWAASCRYSRH
jgi:hypothetical protein